MSGAGRRSLLRAAVLGALRRHPSSAVAAPVKVPRPHAGV